MSASIRARPRIEGEREGEIFSVTRDLLVRHGYDRLTLDAIATEARASKATLYRRWTGKVDLVIDALVHLLLETDVDVDTGSLRGDLMSAAARRGGAVGLWTDLLAALVSAMLRDGELAAAFRSQVEERFGAVVRRPYERARDRGEIGTEADLTLLSAIVPSLCSHEMFAHGRIPDPERVGVIVDTILLPACRATLRQPSNAATS
ncbi:MAG: TetR/AcrR family transcriptional regulator [Propionibacteriaceae bacterium]